MVIGFDERNLSTAVLVAMAHAKKVEQTEYVHAQPSGVTKIDLTDKQQVRDMLMDRAEKLSALAPSARTAELLGMAYGHVGVVLEESLGEMRPRPVSRTDGRVTHLAMFWAVL